MPASKAKIAELNDKISTCCSGFNSQLYLMIDTISNYRAEFIDKKIKLQAVIRADPRNVLTRIRETDYFTVEIVKQIKQKNDEFFLSDEFEPGQNGSWAETIGVLKSLWKDSLNDETKESVWRIVQKMTGIFVDYLEAVEELEEAVKP